MDIFKCTDIAMSCPISHLFDRLDCTPFIKNTIYVVTCYYTPYAVVFIKHKTGFNYYDSSISYALIYRGVLL